jgi:hypothetical protein
MNPSLIIYLFFSVGAATRRAETTVQAGQQAIDGKERTSLLDRNRQLYDTVSPFVAQLLPQLTLSAQLPPR